MSAKSKRARASTRKANAASEARKAVSMKKRIRQLNPEQVGLTSNPGQRMPQIDTAPVDIENLGRLHIETISDQTVDLDHNKACEYVDLPVFAGEREFSETHVQFLYDELRKGTFNPLLVILATATLDGHTYKINGQHTCWATLFMPKSYSMKVREIRFRVRDKDQLRMLYSTFDRLLARSDGHISKVLLVDNPQLAGVRPSAIARYNSGFAMWLYQSRADRKRISPDQLSAVILSKHADLYRTVALFHQENEPVENRSLVSRQPIIAALFATFARVATKAPGFWEPVFSGVGLDSKTDPRWKLRTYLQGHALGATAASKGKTTVDRETMYRVCIQAWNYWRDGKPMQVAPRATKERVSPK